MIEPTPVPIQQTSAPPTPTPLGTAMLEPTSCRSGSVGSNVKCYDLTVPEHHSNPSGRTLRLHVAVYKSTLPDRVADPILFLMGGPGAPGIASYGWAAGNFPPFNSRRDVVALDQRGTGHSIPKLACPEYNDFLKVDEATQRPSAESIAQDNAAFRTCHDRLITEGVDLSAYTNAETAADVEDLRRALGIDAWNLFGWSYGTRLALTVVRDFPHSVRSMVLDSPYPLQANQLAEYAKNYEVVFQRLFERCAAEAKCAQAYPQLEQAFYQVMDELDAHPVKVGNTLVTGARFIDLIGALLMDSYEIRQLPDLIYETHQGKHALLDSKVRQIFTYDDYFADGLQYSINCADEVAFISPDAVATGASSVNAHFARYFDELAQIDFGICSFWGARPALPIESAPVVSDVPTLVLVGDTDPFTPPTWAKLTAATLSQSQIAEFPGLGHGVFRADFMTKYCVSHLVGDFLDHPASKLDMKCLDTFRTTPIGFG